MSQIDLSEVPGLQVRVNNALAHATSYINAYCEIRSVFRITENLYQVEGVIAQQHCIRFLVFDVNEQVCHVYLDSLSFRMLVLDPMTRDVQQAIKDYHSIGHGWPKGE